MNINKKEKAKSKNVRKRNTIEYIHDEDELNNSKNKRNKEMLDKHLKDNSFKFNASATVTETNIDRIAKLETLVTKDTLVLTLKVKIS